MTTVRPLDIDGTLERTGGAGRRAMARAFEDLSAVTDCFRHIRMAERSDTWILSSAVAPQGILPSRLAQFEDAYLAHPEREFEPPSLNKMIIPGVRAPRTRALRLGAILGLPTMRWVETAWHRRP